MGFDPSGLSPGGPWLVYGVSDVPDWGSHRLWIVNEDGSGWTPVTLAFYDGSKPASLANPSNQLALLAGMLYLVRPDRAEAIGIDQPVPEQYQMRETRFDTITFQGDDKAGFLTSVHSESEDGPFELVLHELPRGDIVERFPAVSCDGCGIGDVYWSHAGRYFAFAASLDSPSTNLYVYDTLRKKLRRLTSGTETVENISWSPHDGYLAFTISQVGRSSHLLVYDLAHDATRRLTGWLDPVWEVFWSPGEDWLLADVHSAGDEGEEWPDMALWSVRINGGAARWLNSTHEQPGTYSYFVHWLDANRLLFSLGEKWEPRPPHRLTRVDLASGEVERLYCCSFNGYALDPATLTVALNVDSVVYSWSPRLDTLPWYEGPGIYLVSPSRTTPKLAWADSGNISDPLPNWNEDLKLFTQSIGCNRPQGGEGIQAIDRVGGLHCIEKPVQEEAEEVYISPDEQWQVLVKEGIWLETGEGKVVARVSEEDATIVTWRPDSRGFFVRIIRKGLFHVSVPDLSMKEVDAEAMMQGFQWLETRDP